MSECFGDHCWTLAVDTRSVRSFLECDIVVASVEASMADKKGAPKKRMIDLKNVAVEVINVDRPEAPDTKKQMMNPDKYKDWQDRTQPGK